MMVPNDRLVGATLTFPEGAEPVPVIGTLSAVELLLTVISQVAVRVPEAVGLNTMVAVQEADAANVDVQVVEEIEKSPELVPVIEPVPSVTAAVVPFETVMV